MVPYVSDVEGTANPRSRPLSYNKLLVRDNAPYSSLLLSLSEPMIRLFDLALLEHVIRFTKFVDPLISLVESLRTCKNDAYVGFLRLLIL